jgi:hypothetical protein
MHHATCVSLMEDGTKDLSESKHILTLIAVSSKCHPPHSRAGGSNLLHCAKKYRMQISPFS